MGVMPGAEPFAADGGDMGVGLSHGFTGAPRSLRPWAEHLAAAGMTVRLPRLPGHGTRWQDLNDTRRPDRYGEVERAFDDLPGRCRQVFAVAPLSGRLREGARSTVVTEVILEESYHVATLDHDAPDIFAGTVEWIQRHPAVAGSARPAGD